MKIIAILISIGIFFSSAGLSMRMQELNPGDNHPADEHNGPIEETRGPVIEPKAGGDSTNHEGKIEEKKPEEITEVNPVIEQETEKDEENDEEGQSILSFNFIFYMLHKFKFSDLLSPQ